MVRASKDNFFNKLKQEKQDLKNEFLELSDYVERIFICVQTGKYDQDPRSINDAKALFDDFDEKADSLYNDFIGSRPRFEDFDPSSDYRAVKSRLKTLKETVNKVAF